MEVVRPLEDEGPFPHVHYAFGVLRLEWTRWMKSRGKQWVSEIEVSHPIQWKGQWRRENEVTAEVRQAHPESFRAVKGRGRKGEEKVFVAQSLVQRAPASESTSER